MIGGKFGLAYATSNAGRGAVMDFLPDGEAHFFVNARSALMALVKSLNPSRIWFPSYFCPSMLQSLGRRESRLCFYPVNSRLEIEVEANVLPISDGELVVVIDYFGFRSASNFVQQCISNGVYVVEDRCQSLLSDHAGVRGQFQLFSPRKFFGFPDGGILINNSNFPLEFESLAQPPQAWLKDTLYALELKSKYDAGKSMSKEWFELIQDAEKNIPCGSYAMSDVSLRLLSSNIDVSGSATQRRLNFKVLAENLQHYGIFQSLPDEVVPLGFPVHVNRRNLVQGKLFSRNIFPPIHWNLEGQCPEIYSQSLNLSNEIMTLPCDQRYLEKDMSLLAEEFLEIVC